MTELQAIAIAQEKRSQGYTVAAWREEEDAHDCGGWLLRIENADGSVTTCDAEEARELQVEEFEGE